MLKNSNTDLVVSKRCLETGLKIVEKLTGVGNAT